jgi:hypothetical protein
MDSISRTCFSCEVRTFSDPIAKAVVLIEDIDIAYKLFVRDLMYLEDLFLKLLMQKGKNMI